MAVNDWHFPSYAWQYSYGKDIARMGSYRNGILDRSFFVISTPKAKIFLAAASLSFLIFNGM
jgi:hypothetical protein